MLRKFVALGGVLLLLSFVTGCNSKPDDAGYKKEDFSKRPPPPGYGPNGIKPNPGPTANQANPGPASGSNDSH